MGKLDLFQIIFDHPQRVHFAGQWVRGTVIVGLTAPMKMTGISLNLSGRSNVHWFTGGKTRAEYRAEEIYFDEAFTLFGSSDPGETTVLPPGNYEYPFEFLLLADLPSSFEGEFGFVRYIAQATIDKPWKFDHVTKEAFTVLSTLDLNYEDISLREPFVMTEDMTVSCCCCISGSVEANITINKRCFVPGETIYINGDITNNSNSTIHRARALLVQHITFKAPCTSLFSTSKMFEKEVTAFEVKAEGEAIKPGQVDKWNNVPLVVPSLPPSRLDGCEIIDVNYKFQFHVDVDYADYTMKTDVLIGTVPLFSGTQHYSPPMPCISEKKGEPIDDENNAGDQLGNEQMPPAYEECIVGRVPIKEAKDSEYVRGTLVWAPMYPMYQFAPVESNNVLISPACIEWNLTQDT